MPISEQGQGTVGTLPGPELSVIVPTFNERDNIVRLVDLLESCLAGVRWELIVVDDDSPDKTVDIVRNLACANRHVRCVQRIGRRGLSSACLEGMLSSSAPFLAVMDGDLQHDERLLPEMLRQLKQGGYDIVIGSRYMAGGSIGQWGGFRARTSRLATFVSRPWVPEGLTDPMSGFFALRRDTFDLLVRRTSGLGFKLLLDFFASSPRPLRFKELPFEFRTRYAGESKVDGQVVWEYFMLLLDKSIGRFVPVRLVAFALVGGSGVAVHFASLLLLYRGLSLPFAWGQTLATLLAMTSNFALNNLITYRDRRLRGRHWARGWLSFVLVCGLGAIGNVGVASYLFRRDLHWGVSAMAGILVGTVWNYAVTASYTWKVKAR
ncbi:MAG: Undecaprenyl-phosphate 4-deoxy-4-formamido-L-arabinose transferase [Nitrospirae bacterium]|nr:MAG: glycosyl transferase family 2 protein [Nitrospira sp. OLB3]MBV6470400.1 Undecaprenyl-phosphate 4-deoxy-4-formamido-L-arabinose transferase [Nitrospirota bacterium]MEB2339585.1 glycosyltransferase family 2 protein [Nitrospirales bacterium]QOJ36504.1 MAG: glycosyltransferase family 2 protein [Nitrospira sp.]